MLKKHIKPITAKSCVEKFSRKVNCEIGHWEGKYFCACRTRKYRMWLGMKQNGFKDELD